ncbi:hypothetical protein Tco_1135262 [Tanacetum coccineum]
MKNISDLVLNESSFRLVIPTTVHSVKSTTRKHIKKLDKDHPLTRVLFIECSPNDEEYKAEEYKTEQLVAEEKAGYENKPLTFSSTELEIQSMVDVPIHQEDLAVQ